MSMIRVTRLARYSADVYYMDDGYFYYADNSTGTRIHLKCILYKTCPARASIPLQTSEWTVVNFVQHGEHNHGPDPAYFSTETLRKCILERCKAEATPFSVIFDEECARVPVEVSGRFGFNSLKSTMYRARRMAQNVVVPQSLVEYGFMVEGNVRFSKSIGNKDFYRGTVEDAEAGAAVIFASEHFLRLLPDANELHMDATFKVVPNVPACHQLFTIMAIHYDHAFPVVSVLMEKRTREAYDNIFNFIKNIVPGLQPEIVITDFERTLQESVRAAFPEAQLVGCWFHVANTMYKKARSFGLANQMFTNANVQKIVRMCISLPLLPGNKMQEGYDYVVQQAELNNINENMRRFLNYVLRTWIQGVGVQAMSVFGQIRQTNNDQESYHRALFQKLRQAHPDIWTFTDGMQKVENAFLQKYFSLENGTAGARVRKSSYILNDRKIKLASEKLLEDHYTIGEFLNVVSHAMENVYTGNIFNQDDDDDDEDISGPPSSTPPSAMVAGLGSSRPPIIAIDDHADNGDMSRRTSTSASSVADIINIQMDDSARGRGRRRVRRNTRRGIGHAPALSRNRGTPEESINTAQPQIINVPLVPQTNDTEQIERPIGNDENNPLPLTYRNYRFSPVVFFPHVRWPLKFIDIQKEELLIGLALGNEATVEWNTNSNYPPCTICLLNEANRICSPCGHPAFCRPCLTLFLNTNRYYMATVGGHNFGKPLQCPLCRAIIGNIVTIY